MVLEESVPDHGHGLRHLYRGLATDPWAPRGKGLSEGSLVIPLGLNRCFCRWILPGCWCCSHAHRQPEARERFPSGPSVALGQYIGGNPLLRVSDWPESKGHGSRLRPVCGDESRGARGSTVSTANVQRGMGHGATRVLRCCSRHLGDYLVDI